VDGIPTIDTTYQEWPNLLFASTAARRLSDFHTDRTIKEQDRWFVKFDVMPEIVYPSFMAINSYTTDEEELSPENFPADESEEYLAGPCAIAIKVREALSLDGLEGVRQLVRNGVVPAFVLVSLAGVQQETL
jgi:hypothetical protein